MSMNTAHANNGVLLHAGERQVTYWKLKQINSVCFISSAKKVFFDRGVNGGWRKNINNMDNLIFNRILLFCDNVTMSFSGLREPAFDGDKSGRLYLTTHRMVFNNKNQKDGMKSFSFPFVAIRNVELEQPVFGANYIKGTYISCLI